MEEKSTVQTREAMFYKVTEACSCYQCCCGKETSFTYS